MSAIGKLFNKWQVGVACFSVGDRFSSKHSANHCCTVIKIRNSGKKPYTIQWDDGRKVHCDISWLIDMNFLEEKGEANAVCSDTPASLQESPVLNSALKQPKQLTSSKQDCSLKTIPTLKQFSDTDSQISPYIATSGTISPNQDNSTSTQLDFLVPEQALQGTVQDLTTQNQNSGLKLCAASQTVAPASSSLKILQGLSTEDYEQFLGDCEWLATSGMIRKSYQLRNSDRPTKEKDCSSLPTPTTYAKGSTGCRPAGQTRLEQKLKPFITPGDKLNPAVPGWMMGFPVGWVEYPLMDTGETISVQLPFIPEYATTSTNGEIATTSMPDQSVPSKQRSPLSESFTSIPCVENKQLQQVKAITLHQPWAYLVGRYKWFETRSWLTNYRGKIAIHAAKRQKDTDYCCCLLEDLLPLVEELVFGAVVAIADLTDCILITEEFINQQSETELRCGLWKPGRYAWKLENVQILPEPIPARGKQGLWNIELPFALAQPAAGIAPQSLIDRFLEENWDYEWEQQSEPLVLCPSCELQHIYLSGGCGMCGLAPANFLEEKTLFANIECTQQLQIGDRIRILKTRTQNFGQWIGHEATVTGINGEIISVAAGVRVASRREGREKKHLTLKKGWYELIPKNFLEESREVETPAQQAKPSKQKGCLYRYLENKKLKDGRIATYPRIMEDKRDSDNPQHWRWGFNWEEKIDGEWKGRSIGSIPVGAVPMIQSMQNQGVPLEEIIAFIKKSKMKNKT